MNQLAVQNAELEQEIVEEEAAKVDPNRPRPHGSGELHMWVLQGENIKNGSAFSTADPYCEVVHLTDDDQRRHKTREIDNDLNPTWNEKFVWPIEDSTATNDFTFTVYDKTLGGKKKLGQGEMSIALVFDYKGNIDVTVSLHPQGKVVTHCEWIPDGWGDAVYAGPC